MHVMLYCACQFGSTSVRQHLPPTLPDPTTPPRKRDQRMNLLPAGACRRRQAGGRWRPVSRRVPCVLCEAKRHATMHVAPLCDSPIQQRPAGWFASACTSLPAAAGAQHERPTVLPPVTACPLRPARGTGSCDHGFELPPTLLDPATRSRPPQGTWTLSRGRSTPLLAIHRTTRKLALLLAMSTGRMPFTS